VILNLKNSRNIGVEMDTVKSLKDSINDGLLEMLVDSIKGNFPQLIVWRENDKIVGHAVWHESSTEEHRKGHPRDKEDKEALEKLLGGKKDLVELHEWWWIKLYLLPSFLRRTRAHTLGENTASMTQARACIAISPSMRSFLNKSENQ
jgi:hypothetical protein